MMNRSRFEDYSYGAQNSSMNMTTGAGGAHYGSFHQGNTSYVNYGSPANSQQTGIEPMHYSPIGGPNSPPVLGGSDRVTYLPSFLLGEPSKSPKGKLRKDVMTPHLDLSTINSPQAMYMDRSGPSSQTPTYGRVQSPTTPPVSNLFNTSVASRSAAPGPASTSTPAASKGGPPKHGLGTGSSGPATTPTKSAVGEGTQGSWITVFGFQPSNQTFVLQTFSTIGSIIEYKAAPGCNWIHIRYSSNVEARKALAKNGSIIGGNMMVGVMKYNANGPSPLAPTVSGASAAVSPENAEPAHKTRIRPLASDNLVNQLPVRESGILSKVTELFGW